MLHSPRPIHHTEASSRKRGASCERISAAMGSTGKDMLSNAVFEKKNSVFRCLATSWVTVRHSCNGNRSHPRYLGLYKKCLCAPSHHRSCKTILLRPGTGSRRGVAVPDKTTVLDFKALVLAKCHRQNVFQKTSVAIHKYLARWRQRGK